MNRLDFFIERDMVVLDCWVVDKVTRKRLRKATIQEEQLWERLTAALTKLELAEKDAEIFTSGCCGD